MNLTDFHQVLGRLSRTQGWTLESIATIALAFIASNQTRRQQFIRLLNRIAREENEASTHSE